jgi:hypothetical protein
MQPTKKFALQRSNCLLTMCQLVIQAGVNARSKKQQVSCMPIYMPSSINNTLNLCPSGSAKPQ